MGGGAVAAEAFQALRGQKGPLRYLGGKAWDGLKNKLSGQNPKTNKQTMDSSNDGPDSHSNSNDFQSGNKSHSEPPKYISDILTLIWC